MREEYPSGKRQITVVTSSGWMDRDAPTVERPACSTTPTIWAASPSSHTHW
jgi:hypothetical protein